jgi:hypothetical protein
MNDPVMTMHKGTVPLSFFNTTKERGKALQEYIDKARGQNLEVLSFFMDRPYEEYTPSNVHQMLNFEGPLTSIRRAMTTLTKDGYLIKTDNKRIGIWGRPEHTWKYIPEEEKVI